MNKERCFKWNIDCEFAPKPHIDKDAIPGCIFDGTETCNEQILKNIAGDRWDVEGNKLTSKKTGLTIKFKRNEK